MSYGRERLPHRIDLIARTKKILNIMSEDFCADVDSSNKESNAIYNEQRWWILAAIFLTHYRKVFLWRIYSIWQATKRGNIKLIL